MMNIIKTIYQVNWIKSIYFNFFYFQFKDAIKFPCLVYKRTVLQEMGGKIKLVGRISTGMFLLGVPRLGVQDRKFSRTMWSCQGELVIHHLARIGQGCKICISNNGKLSLGSNFRCTGETSFYCYKKIAIGNDCLFSWNINLMDTDFHRIYEITDETETCINPNRPINIGDHVWIASGCTILKGVTIPSYSVLASGSICSSSNIMKCENTIYGGIGKNLVALKNNINWKI